MELRVPEQKINHLSRPSGLGDLAQAGNDGDLASILSIEKDKAGAIAEDDVAGIGTKGGVFTSDEELGGASLEILDGDGEASGAYGKGHLASVGRPTGLRAVAIAGGDQLPGAAARTDLKKLRAAALVGGINDLGAIRGPCGRGLDASGTGQAAGATAAGTDDVKLGISVLAQGAGDTSAIGRKGGAGVGAGELDDAVAGSRGELDQVDIGITALVAGVGELRGVIGNGGSDADGAVTGELPDIGAIVIGDVDFLAAGAGGDEGDL